MHYIDNRVPQRRIEPCKRLDTTANNVKDTAECLEILKGT